MVKKARSITQVFSVFILCFLLTPAAFAVPETNAVRVTDVTASSFSVVWMTDVAADASVEIYADKSMQQRVTEGFVFSTPTGSAAQAGRAKGIMKVQVTGTQPATTYYARTVTTESANPLSVSYSSLQQVTTASSVALYLTRNNVAQGISNDILSFPVYVRPIEQGADPRLGDLIVLDVQGSSNSVSAFVGDGTVSPEGLLDFNNLFGADGTSLAVAGGEVIALRIYRGGNLSTLTHYRKAPQNSTAVSLANPLKGFFADINLDGNIDDADFQAFKAQYRTGPNDPAYNPDFNFISDPTGTVDIRDFGKFSKEYGRTNVQ